jgi:hypothetical protein
VAFFGLFAVSAVARPVTHGQLLNRGHIVNPFNANQSTNWFGYNQAGSFHSITSDWTVPTATSHTPGQDQGSSTWAGIGGGCTDASCSMTDPTLIQTGTEQDVDSTGHPSYSAWWEIIPLPSMTISSLQISPGDQMHADITETPTGSETWTITLKDVTKNQSFSTQVPYPSTYATAEWIEETPLEIGGSGGAGTAALPNLSKVPFDHGGTNGAAAKLSSPQQIQLVDQSQKVIGQPSAPDSDADGFGACTWTTTCSAPGS